MTHESYHSTEGRIITVTLAEQKALGVSPEAPRPRRVFDGQPPVILDNGTFPKTQPCARKRARARWKRTRRSS